MNAWEITRKDLKLLARDRRALTLLVVFPLVFITIIGLTTGQLLGWNQSNKILKIAFVDEADYRNFPEEPGRKLLKDPTRQRHLVAKIANRIQNTKGFHIYAAPDRAAARRMMDEKSEILLDNGEPAEANVTLVIGPEFTQIASSLEIEDIFRRDQGPLAEGLAGLDIELLSDEDESSAHAIIDSFVYGEVLASLTDYILCSHREENNLTLNARIVKDCKPLAAEDSQPVPELAKPVFPDEVADNVVYQQTIPGLTVMFVFFIVNIMARSFISERDLGTLRRLRLAPVRSSSILTGKIIPFYLISLLQTVLLFLFGRYLFNMSWGPTPMMMLPIIFATSLAATALGLLIATLVHTDSQVSAYANFTVITMAGVSGCFMPREWLPEAMQTGSLATPHAWSLIAYEQLLSTANPDLQTVWECSAILVGFAAVFFAFGIVFFRRSN